MKKTRLLIMLGSVCLALMLAVPLVASCGPATPEEAAAEIAALESKLAAEKAKSSGLEDNIADLEDEIAALRAPAEVHKLVYQLSAPIATPYGDMVKRFITMVEDATDGRIQITLKSGGEIVPSHEATEAVKKGVIDMAHPNAAMDLGRFGDKALLLGASGFPAGPNPIEYLAWLYEGGGLAYTQEMYKDYAYGVGQVTVCPAELFCHSNVKLDSIESLDGIKFRTMGFWAEVMESFGASIVTVPGGEIYELAQRGAIDAFEYCGPAIDWTVGFHEVTKYIGMPGIHSPMSSNVLLVNWDKWNELPDDLKSTLTAVCKSSSFLDYIDIASRDANGLLEYEKYGTEMVVLPDEMQKAIAERSKEIVERNCKEDSLYNEIFQSQKEFISKFRTRHELMQPKYSVFD